MAKKNRDRSTEARQARAMSTETASEKELRELRSQAELKAEREAIKQTTEAETMAEADFELEDLVFDFSDFSLRESLALANAPMAMQEAQREFDEYGDRIPRDVREQSQADAFDMMRRWFSRVCAQVPLDWFAKSTRDEVLSGDRQLDFSDPETYLDLQDVKLGRLINAMSYARQHSEKK